MISSVSEIKARLASVKQTRQITNAMYLLSASRLKKLAPGMDYAVSYMQRLRSAGGSDSGPRVVAPTRRKSAGMPFSKMSWICRGTLPSVGL